MRHHLIMMGMPYLLMSLTHIMPDGIFHESLGHWITCLFVFFFFFFTVLYFWFLQNERDGISVIIITLVDIEKS